MTSQSSVIVYSTQVFCWKMSDVSAAQRKPNFSALSNTNGVSKGASPMANTKPGSTKKLIIKNFKGTGNKNNHYHDNV